MGKSRMSDGFLSIRHRFAALGIVSRGSLTIAGGTAAGNAILGLAMLILARLYGGRQFGEFAVYTSILALSMVVATLKLDLAIPLPREDADAKAIFVACILVTTAVGLAMIAGLRLVPGWNERSQVAGGEWLLPFGVLAGGYYQALSSWAIRARRHAAVASSRLIQRAIQAVAQILGGAKRTVGTDRWRRHREARSGLLSRPALNFGDPRP